MKNTIKILKAIWECIFWTGQIWLIAYVFLAMCNWSVYISHWGGFSHFLCAIVVFATIIMSWQHMSSAIMKVRAKDI